MPRPRKTGKGLPNGVYWQKGAWRYKARNAQEREILGRLWTRLGTTVESVHQNYWHLVGSQISSAGGMTLLWKEYCSRVLPTKATRTQADNETHWQILEPVFGHCHPGEITRSHGIQYLQQRGAQSASQARQEFALLRHMLNKAVDWEIIDRNPLAGTRVADYIPAAVRDRTPEIWEMLAVKKHGTAPVQLFIDFKYQSGLDQSTCFGLKIPSFDGPGLPVQRSKTHRKGYIEWTEEFKDTCRALIAYNNNRCPYLFCNSQGNPWRVDSFSQAFRKAVRRAIAAGALLEPFTPNDIRSAHATDAEELHGLDATKQLLNGPGAKKHYVHLRRGQKITPLPGLKIPELGRKPKSQ